MNAFSFEPSSASNLGFCRLLFFSLLYIYYFTRPYTEWGSLPRVFADRPIDLFAWFHLPLPSVRALTIWQFAWKTLLFTSAIGLLTPLSVIGAMIASVYVLGTPGNFGKTGHGEDILILTMLILACSKCGDAWSVDRLIFKKPITRSGEYTWPIKMTWLLMSLIFVSAGITKLRFSGYQWVTTDNLSIVIQQHYRGNLSTPASRFGLWIASHQLLCKLIAAMTMGIELSFPLALFSKRLRWILVPSMLLAQIMIYLTMGVAFTQFMIVYLFWIPWADMTSRLATKRRRCT